MERQEDPRGILLGDAASHEAERQEIVPAVLDQGPIRSLRAARDGLLARPRNRARFRAQPACAGSRFRSGRDGAAIASAERARRLRHALECGRTAQGRRPDKGRPRPRLSGHRAATGRGRAKGRGGRARPGARGSDQSPARRGFERARDRPRLHGRARGVAVAESKSSRTASRTRLSGEPRKRSMTVAGRAGASATTMVPVSLDARVR